jgi:isopenicillin-N epimerase
MTPRPTPSPLSSHWTLSPDVVFLNHGSFGACPRVVQEAQQRVRAEMEAQLVLFLDRQLEERLDTARRALGGLLGAAPQDLVFVGNATTGVNAVLQSLSFKPGDELLTTSHAYNACANALRFVADRFGAVVTVAPLPFPVTGRQALVDAVMSLVTPRTRLVLLDHVTSPTGIILPVEELVEALQARGIDVLVDGAHAPGMVPLNLTKLNAAYYTGNLHKWICAPKGAAFLHVRADRQHLIRPTTISHGANSPRRDRSRFLLEFDWTGTTDPSPALCIPDAIRFMETLMPGGLDAVRAHNHALVLQGRGLLCDALGIPAPCPEDLLGSLASVPLPDGPTQVPTDGPPRDPVATALWERFGIELPVFTWPRRPGRLLRISAQAYNSVEQYRYLVDALKQVL